MAKIRQTRTIIKYRKSKIHNCPVCGKVMK